MPVDTLSWHFDARADSSDFSKVCLKIGLDANVIRNESRALMYFKGHGMIQIFDQDTEQNALLLKQAIPGQTLKKIVARDVFSAMKSFTDVVDKLQSMSAKREQDDFEHVTDWLAVFERVPKDALPNHIIDKVIHMAGNLLKKESSSAVLHGDLHLDNIISDQHSWVAIDPKGIIGSREFELAAFDFLLDHESKSKDLWASRVHQLAHLAKIDPQILSDWIFVRLVLNACWMVEDNGDPKVFLDRIALI